MAKNEPKHSAAFVLLAPFPTRKAYGVTTQYTLESICNAGYNIELFNLSPELIRQAKKLKLPEILFFALYKLIKLLSFIYSSFFVHYEFVWTRSPSVMLSLIWSRNQICVVEIHKEWHKVLFFLINMIPTKRVLLLPVSNLLLKSAMEFMPLKRSNILYSPMAVSQSYIKFGENYRFIPHRDLDLITICYIGRFRSSGKLQGLEEFIKCLSQVDSKYKFKFRMIGVGLEGQQLILNMLAQSSVSDCLILETYLDLDHLQILSLIDDVDIFLLPYPEGRYFAGRFPIKAVEYMSLKRPILATNTISHKAIFAPDRAFFFNFNSVESLSRAFKSYSNFSNQDLAKMVDSNFQFALENSYDKRTERVLRLIRSALH